MSDQQARQTPIIDLLRDIPADARMVYEVTSTHHQSIPVGVLAKNAADEIERLTACLKKANDQAEHFEREWYLRGDEIERLTAERSERELDSDRLASLVWPEQFCDEYNGVDLHEQASIYASAFGRDEPNRDDYLAAIRTAIDARDRSDE